MTPPPSIVRVTCFVCLLYEFSVSLSEEEDRIYPVAIFTAPRQGSVNSTLFEEEGCPDSAPMLARARSTALVVIGTKSLSWCFPHGWFYSACRYWEVNYHGISLSRLLSMARAPDLIKPSKRFHTF